MSKVQSFKKMESRRFIGEQRCQLTKQISSLHLTRQTGRQWNPNSQTQDDRDGEAALQQELECIRERVKNGAKNAGSWRKKGCGEGQTEGSVEQCDTRLWEPGGN